MPTFGGAPSCPVCNEKVYFAEEVKCLSNSYHKMCLKCAECRKLLDISTVNDHDNSIYCRICYGKKFGPKGYGFASGGAGLQTEGLPFVIEKGSDITAVSPSSPSTCSASSIAKRFGGGSEKCSRCSQTVYFNERLQASGRVFHRGCFKCGHCSKLLELGSECQHRVEVYCRGCYNRHYGTKGFVAGSSMHVS